MTFIGPRPVVEAPTFVTPFAARYDKVFDADGKIFALADPRGEAPADDNEMATAIADALNEKFGKPEPTTAEPTPEPVHLRTLLVWRLDGEFVKNERVYEVTPGRFCWGNSREYAGMSGFTWAFPNTSYTFRDVETGEDIDQVTGKPVDA